MFSCGSDGTPASLAVERDGHMGFENEVVRPQALPEVRPSAFVVRSIECDDRTDVMADTVTYTSRSVGLV